MQMASCASIGCPNPVMVGCPDCGRGFCARHCPQQVLSRPSLADRYPHELEWTSWEEVLCDECVAKRQENLAAHAAALVASVSGSSSSQANRSSGRKRGLFGKLFGG